MMIQILNLYKRYKKRLNTTKFALEDLTLGIKSGEVFGFLGPNGAGKSTLIKILMNFIRPTAGSAQIDGHVVSDHRVRCNVGYLPENPYFYDHLTAEEILTFGGKAAKMGQKDIRYRIDHLLERLKLSHAKKERIRSYSKGMVQRTGLGLALIHNPKLCILDEPMSGLDPIGRRLVADLIEEMRYNGQTVFFSSHILSDIERLCDRVGILNHGRLLYCGGMKEFVIYPEGLEQSFIKLIEKDEERANGADLASR
jgi:ABC-2 type transport system ATP-binding protein